LAQKKIEFEENRSGQSLVSIVMKSINYNEWSHGNTSNHLINQSYYSNSFISVYDYDIKIFIFMICVIVEILTYRYTDSIVQNWV